MRARIPDQWLIVKYGLYYRPEAQGYTGLRAEAGICAWCGDPLPTAVRAHTNKPRTYCSHACDVARRNKRDYYAEEVEFMAASGSGAAAIVQQIGVKAPTLLRSLERAGRPDLASIVRPLARRDKGSAA